MTDVNNVWQESISITEVDHFEDWLNIEKVLGEFGEPGFSQITYGLRWAPIDPDNVVSCTFTSYRDDSGQILCAHGFHNKNGVHTPFIFYVHPDHMRKGLGTSMIDYIQTQYFENHGEYINFEASWNGAVITDAMLSFMNKYSTNALEKRKES